MFRQTVFALMTLGVLSPTAMAASVANNHSGNWLLMFGLLMLVAGIVPILNRLLRKAGVLCGLIAGLVLGQSGLQILVPSLSEANSVLAGFLLWVPWIIMFDSGSHFRMGVLHEHWRTTSVGLAILLIGSALGAALGYLLIVLFPELSPSGNIAAFCVLLGLCFGTCAIIIVYQFYLERDIGNSPWGLACFSSLGLNELGALVLFSMASGVFASGGSTSLSQTLLIQVVLVVGVLLGLFLLEALELRGRNPVSRLLAWHERHVGGQQKAVLSTYVGAAILAGVGAECFGLNGLIGAFATGVIVSTVQGYRESTRKALDISLGALFTPAYFGMVMLSVDIRKDLSLSMLVLTLVVVFGSCAVRMTVINALWMILRRVDASFTREYRRFATWSHLPNGVTHVVIAYWGVEQGIFGENMLVAWGIAVAVTTAIANLKLHQAVRTNITPGALSVHFFPELVADNAGELMRKAFTRLITRLPDEPLQLEELMSMWRREELSRRSDMGFGGWIVRTRYPGKRVIVAVVPVAANTRGLSVHANTYDNQPVTQVFLIVRPQHDFRKQEIVESDQLAAACEARIVVALKHRLLQLTLTTGAEQGLAKKIGKELLLAVLNSSLDPEEMKASANRVLSDFRQPPQSESSVVAT